MGRTKQRGHVIQVWHGLRRCNASEKLTLKINTRVSSCKLWSSDTTWNDKRMRTEDRWPHRAEG
eukprot:scaffold6009_cov248-Pinguiococcus_pyrenoidosus.AAC.6